MKNTKEYIDTSGGTFFLAHHSTCLSYHLPTMNGPTPRKPARRDQQNEVSLPEDSQRWSRCGQVWSRCGQPKMVQDYQRTPYIDSFKHGPGLDSQRRQWERIHWERIQSSSRAALWPRSLRERERGRTQGGYFPHAD